MLIAPTHSLQCFHPVSARSFRAAHSYRQWTPWVANVVLEARNKILSVCVNLNITGNDFEKKKKQIDLDDDYT